MPRDSPHATHREPKAGALLCGRYRLVAPLEAGRIATTYRALDTGSGRTVAVKIFDEVGRHETNRLESSRRLSSNGVSLVELPSTFVAVHDCNLADDGRLFVVAESVPPRTLADLLKTAPLEPARALEVAMWVGEALEVALNLGFTDIPLAPSDVAIDEGERPRLLRSDVAILQRLGLGDRLKAVEASSRDPRYASPEELAHLPPTERSAIYRFGVLIYELLYGSPPFAGTTPAALRLEIRRGPERLRARHRVLSASLDRLVARMLALDPLLRPAALTPILNELWDELCRHRGALQGRQPGIASATLQQLPQSPRSRHWALIIASIGAMAILFLAWPYLGPRLNFVSIGHLGVGSGPAPPISGGRAASASPSPSTPPAPAEHITPTVPIGPPAGQAQPQDSARSLPGRGPGHAGVSVPVEAAPSTSLEPAPSPIQLSTEPVTPPPPRPIQSRPEDTRAADPGAIIDWLVGATPQIGE